MYSDQSSNIDDQKHGRQKSLESPKSLGTSSSKQGQHTQKVDQLSYGLRKLLVDGERQHSQFTIQRGSNTSGPEGESMLLHGSSLEHVAQVSQKQAESLPSGGIPVPSSLDQANNITSAPLDEQDADLKRREKNREAAKRSRAKRKAQHEDLQGEVTRLEKQCKQLAEDSQRLQMRLQHANMESTYLKSMVDLYNIKDKLASGVPPAPIPTPMAVRSSSTPLDTPSPLSHAASPLTMSPQPSMLPQAWGALPTLNPSLPSFNAQPSMTPSTRSGEVPFPTISSPFQPIASKGELPQLPNPNVPIQQMFNSTINTKPSLEGTHTQPPSSRVSEAMTIGRGDLTTNPSTSTPSPSPSWMAYNPMWSEATATQGMDLPTFSFQPTLELPPLSGSQSLPESLQVQPSQDVEGVAGMTQYALNPAGLDLPMPQQAAALNPSMLYSLTPQQHMYGQQGDNRLRGAGAEVDQGGNLGSDTMQFVGVSMGQPCQPMGAMRPPPASFPEQSGEPHPPWFPYYPYAMQAAWMQGQYPSMQGMAGAPYPQNMYGYMGMMPPQQPGPQQVGRSFGPQVPHTLPPGWQGPPFGGDAMFQGQQPWGMMPYFGYYPQQGQGRGIPPSSAPQGMGGDSNLPPGQ